jgi:predicted Zn-dependent protease
MKRAASLFVLALVATRPAAASPELYLVDDLAQQSTHAPVRAQAQELAAIYDDLARVAGVEAQLVYSSDPDINAFATETDDGERLVVVQEGLLENLDSDRDAVAAVLGHELAHHKADHLRAGKRKQENVRVLGAILGAVIGAKVGRNSGALAGAASSAAVGVGAGLLALKFNRNQELQADKLTVGWMIEAGYNPQGMLRLQRRLGELQGKRRLGMLSTHPASAKRYKAVEKTIASLAPPQDLLAQPAAPLVTSETLAQVDEQIAGAHMATLDAALAAAADANVGAGVALAPPAPPASSGVTVDDNVHFGRGVRIGGNAVQPTSPGSNTDSNSSSASSSTDD